MLASWSVLHGDIVFSADIARDFFLYKEIETKGVVLIGPRSSVSGLFHGPVWLYLNYPAYFLGKGNPVVLGWYWIFLIALSLIVDFKVADKLFGRLVACFYVLQMSVYAVFHAKGLFNPHGVFFLLPIFYFLLIRYLETNKSRYLFFHFLVGGLLIQFQLAIGIPYVVLSSFLITYRALKYGKKKQLLFLLLIPICLVNFIVFDFRHEFSLSHAVGQFLMAHKREQEISYFSIVKDNLRLIFTGTEILRANPVDLNFNLRIPIVFISAFFLWKQIKIGQHRQKYLVFLYLYLGYFLLSLVNKGFILYFYLYPQFSLVFLIFVSLVTSKYKKVFIVLFGLILMANFCTAIRDTIETRNFIGKNTDSWKFLYGLSKKIYQQPEKEFGYFVYSPDLFAYQAKYAMVYAASVFKNKKASGFEKKPITYLISASHPYFKDRWWRENQVKIEGEPELTFSFDNGYKIEKYLLNVEQVKVPFDANIDTGIHFR